MMGRNHTSANDSDKSKKKISIKNHHSSVLWLSGGWFWLQASEEGELEAWEWNETAVRQVTDVIPRAVKRAAKDNRGHGRMKNEGGKMAGGGQGRRRVGSEGAEAAQKVRPGGRAVGHTGRAAENRRGCVAETKCL